MGNGEVDTSELTVSEVERLKQLIKRFLEDRDIDAAPLNVGADMRKINFCFKHLKEIYYSMPSVGAGNRPSGASGSSGGNGNQSGAGSGGGGGQPNITIVDASLYDSKETKELKETLRQRDNEIGKSVCE